MRCALLLLAGSGCAANLATLQGPETLAPGQVSVAGEAGFGLPLGTTTRAAVAGVNLTTDAVAWQTDGVPVPRETLTEAVASGLGLALSPPGTVYGLSARVGVAEGVDLGLRWSSTDWRLDAKWRFYQSQDQRLAHALHLGLMRQRFSGLVFDLYDPVQSVSEYVPGLELQSPKRWDLELGWLFGHQPAAWLKTYSGARFRLGRYVVPWFLTGEDYGWPEIVSVEDQRGWSPLVGGVGGVALGKDPFWFRAELNLAWTFASTEVLELPVDFGGPTVFPAVGVEIATRPRRR